MQSNWHLSIFYLLTKEHQSFLPGSSTLLNGTQAVKSMFFNPSSKVTFQTMTILQATNKLVNHRIVKLSLLAKIISEKKCTSSKTKRIQILMVISTCKTYKTNLKIKANQFLWSNIRRKALSQRKVILLSQSKWCSAKTKNWHQVIFVTILRIDRSWRTNMTHTGTLGINKMIISIRIAMKTKSKHFKIRSCNNIVKVIQSQLISNRIKRLIMGQPLLKTWWPLRRLVMPTNRILNGSDATLTTKRECFTSWMTPTTNLRTSQLRSWSNLHTNWRRDGLNTTKTCFLYKKSRRESNRKRRPTTAAWSNRKKMT